MPDVAVADCEYVAGADGLISFTVTGAPGEVSWRFGDATDEAASADGVTEHTYSAGGTYEAIGHVHSTGQRMVMTVGVPEFESGGGPAATVTGCTPAQFPAGTTPVLTITGTGLLDASGAFLRGDNGPPSIFTPPFPLTGFAVTDDTSVFGNVAADLPGAGNWYVAVTVDGADVYASSTVWCEPVEP